MQKIVEPSVTVEHDREVYDHPAYAFIQASRVSGHTNLYDSDFKHNQFVTVTIGRSSYARHLSNDWHHDGQELIQIAMSESQWDILLVP